jgi:phosphoglycerate kinase
VDFNVPMKDGVIMDTNKITAAIPTIKYLLDHSAKIILATHLGKPDGKDLKLSTKPLAAMLAKLIPVKITAIDEVIGPEVDNLVSQLNSGEILFLGNLRFEYGEEANDDGFASSLARLAEIYCNDGFAECHRNVVSIVAITKYLPSYAGLLVESEIFNLTKLITNPARPFIIIIGGIKVKDKAGAITNLESKVDRILVGGAVGTTFLVAKGQEVSKSVFDTDMVDACKAMIEKYGDKILLPLDASRENLFGQEYSIKDIGPITIKEFTKEIKRAKTIFWNGNLGHTEEEKYAVGTKEIAEAVNANKHIKVVAGGETVSFIHHHNLWQNFTFISTGGGAALEFLAGKKLPGIIALESNHQ